MQAKLSQCGKHSSCLIDVNAENGAYMRRDIVLD